MSRRSKEPACESSGLISILLQLFHMFCKVVSVIITFTKYIQDALNYCSVYFVVCAFLDSTLVLDKVWHTGLLMQVQNMYFTSTIGNFIAKTAYSTCSQYQLEFHKTAYLVLFYFSYFWFSNKRKYFNNQVCTLHRDNSKQTNVLNIRTYLSLPFRQ